jgi:hypothetical protein
MGELSVKTRNYTSLWNDDIRFPKFEMTSSPPVFGIVISYLVPEFLGVVHVGEVGEFMADDVIDEPDRVLYQTLGKVKVLLY